MSLDVGSRAPYPGLRSFRREESDLFFGRENFVGTLVDRLAATRFLAVLGSSGTGKSSVVKTGLLDALELGLMGKAGSSWRVADFRPGSEPLHNLAAALMAGDPQATPAEIDLLRGFLARGPRSVIEWCRDGNLPAESNLLLLADQFEELFRYQDYARREETQALVELLLESARSSEFPIYVTLTMRSEYLGACALLEGLAEAISRGMVLVPRMTREQCRAAIVRPAEVCGIRPDPPLVNQLLNDLASFASWDDSGTGDELDRLVRRADQLPLLQYTLNRMWLQARERRGGKTDGDPLVLRLADYEAIGGLRGALNAHADQLLKRLAAKGLQDVTETVFRSLVSGATVAEAVRRPRPFGELVALVDGNAQAVHEVVDTFRAPGCNFLTPELDPANPKPLDDDTFIDISHESLIRQWGTLSGWLEQEAHAAQHWRRLQDRMADGDLLRARELAALMSWKKEMKPNAEWAKRYGGDFGAAMNFLDASERAEQRRRVLIRLIPIVVIGIIVSASIFFVVYTERDAQQLQIALTLAQTAKTDALTAKAEAETAKHDAEQAKRTLQEKNLELQAALDRAETAKRDAEAARKQIQEAKNVGQKNAAFVARVKEAGGLGLQPLRESYADEKKQFDGVNPSLEPVKDVNGPTPAMVPGGKVLTTLQLYDALALGTLGAPALVDASGDPPHATIPIAVELPDAGQGGFPDAKAAAAAREKLWNALNKLTGGNFDSPIVFFSSGVENWEGYNAALRAIDLGYSKVYWYRGGLASWKAADQPLVNP